MRIRHFRPGIVFWLFAAALILRLAPLAYLGPGQPFEKFTSFDSSGYTLPALNMLRHGVFSGDDAPPYTPDLLRTPGYPLFLLGLFALFGQQAAPVVIAQAVLGALTVALVWKTAQALDFPPPARLAAAVLLALDPVSILSGSRILTETFFACLLLAGVWLLLRSARGGGLTLLLLAAGLVGWAALTRPIAQYLALALLPLFYLLQPRAGWRQAIIAGLVFALVAGLLPAGWAYRNYRLAGVFTLSDVNTVTLLDYRARPVLADAEGISQEEASERLTGWVDRQAAERGLSRAERAALQSQLAWEVMRAHPLETAKMLVQGTAFLLLDPGYTLACTLLDRTSVRYECFPGRGTMLSGGALEQALAGLGAMTLLQNGVLFAGLALLAVTYLGAAGGLAVLARQRNWAALYLLAGMALYFVALSAGGDINYRFRVPFFPYLALLGGLGVAWFLSRLQKSS